MSTSSSFGKFVVGALVGGAVGAAIGMLLAPRSGAETRELIKEEFDNRYRESADALREKSDVLKEKASALKDRVNEFSSDMEEKGRQAVSRFTEGAKKATETTT